MQRRASHGSALLVSLLGTLWWTGTALAEDLGLPGKAWEPATSGKLASTQSHSLSVDADGTVWSWGSNSFGELGDGTTTPRPTPIRVQGLSDVEAVANGFQHSLALRRDGTVWGWGMNWYGQLGTGQLWTEQLTPVQIPGLTDVSAIAAYHFHSLALRRDGTVWAWGFNDRGQLGDTGNELFVSQPHQVAGLTEVVAIAAGETHNLALRQDGTVWAWGDNSSGQLGDGTQVSRMTAARVADLTDVVAITAAGFGPFSIGMTGHNLALRRDGTVWAWGDNAAGQLGDGTNQTRLTPVRVKGLTDVVALSASHQLSLALRQDGTVWAWGDNAYGQLGLGGTPGSSNTPVRVPELKGVVAISAGFMHALALRRDGALWGWGSNSTGALGTGTNLRQTPATLKNLGNVVSAAFGNPHALALHADGTVWTWGANTYGQLGDGTTAARAEPAPVPGLSNAVAVSAGFDNCFALRADGTVWAWGYNSYGQFGDGTKVSQSTPVRIPGVSGITALSASNTTTPHVLALRSDGTVWAWGDNNSGQLGDGTRTKRLTPAQVPGLADIVAVASGRGYSLALRADGTLWAWGDNGYGQLGDGTQLRRLTPVQVQGLSDVVAITTGAWHTLALRADGSVWAWGYNWYGQLGNGKHQDSTSYFQPTPAPVEGLTDVVALAAGDWHSVVLRTDGTVWAWGDNNSGQLGNGTVEPATRPVQVSGLKGQAVAVAAGANNSLATLGKGTSLAWGSNSASQIGDGVSTAHPVPTRVRQPCRFTGMPSTEHRASPPRECHEAP